MKTTIKINDLKLQKRINTHYYGEVSEFCAAARRFVKALQDGRIISTSKRYGREEDAKYKIKMLELTYDKYSKKYTTLNFNALLMTLGYSVNSHCEILTSGGNVNIYYSLVSSVLNRLHYYGVMSEKEYNKVFGCSSHELDIC